MDDKYIADSTAPNDGPRIFRLLSLKTLKYLFFVLIGVFIIAEIALNVWIGTWIQQRLEEDGPTPKTIARMEKFWETTLDFDPAWLVDRKASEELIDAYRDALETWKRLHENDPSLTQKLNQWKPWSFTQKRWKEFTADIEKAEPYIQDVLKLSQLIEREGKNCTSCFELPNYNPTDYSSGIWDMYNMRRTLDQKAAVLSSEGEYERACDLYFSALPLSFCNPAKEISYYRRKTSHLKSEVIEITRLIPKIDNPKKYQSWLHLLNRYDPLLFAGIGNQVDQFALLNELYRSNRLGIKLDATPGKKSILLRRLYRRTTLRREDVEMGPKKVRSTIFSPIKTHIPANERRTSLYWQNRLYSVLPWINS